MIGLKPRDAGRGRDRLLGGAGLLEHRLRQRGGRGGLVGHAAASRAGASCVAEVFQDNPASARVLMHAGFAYEGDGRDLFAGARRRWCRPSATAGRRGAAREVPRPRPRRGPLRRRRPRLRQLPPREVRRVRRAGRRRRRQGRRRLGRGGRGAEHADRLPLPAAFLRAERPARHGQAAHRQERRRRGAAGAGRHRDPRGGRRDAGRRPDAAGRARAAGAGRQRRLGQPALQVVDQPGAAQRQPRARRGSSARSGCG